MKKKKLIITFLLAFELLLSLVLVTWAWIEGNVSPSVKGNNLVLSSSPGLIIKIGGEQTDVVDLNRYLGDINKTLILTEASSADGKTMFFRTTKALLDSTQSSETTVFMREEQKTGSFSSDANNKYLDLDFQLQAVDKSYDVYFDMDSTSIEYSELDRKAYPIRVYLSAADKAGSTKLFAVCDEGITSREAIAAKDFDRTSGILEEQTDAPSFYQALVLEVFDNYSHRDNPWIHLDMGETVNVKLKLWLEGCDPACTDDISGSTIDFSIKFTTTSAEDRAGGGA